MITLLAVLIVVIGLGFAAVLYLVNQKLGEAKNDSALGLIKQDLQSMNDRLDKAAQVFSGLQNQLGQMQELGRSMRDIQDVLRSPKLRGNVGEQLMGEMLKQQIPRQNYKLQHAFRTGEKVDAVIKTKNGLIPIDSKFPTENYLKTNQAKSDENRAMYHKVFESDVKKHIQVIAKKYILPDEGTVDFALMYVPGEAVYYDIMTTSDLFDYAADQRVYLVSPQSFYHFLKTILVSFEGEMIEERAKEVMNYIKGIQTDARKFGSDFALVDKHLSNARSAMDKAATSFVRLGGKIESAGRLGPKSTAKLEAPDLEPVGSVEDLPE